MFNECMWCGGEGKYWDDILEADVWCEICGGDGKYHESAGDAFEDWDCFFMPPIPTPADLLDELYADVLPLEPRYVWVRADGSIDSYPIPF